MIFPAGTEIAFEIVNALKYSKFVKLYGGTITEDHSEFVFENLIKGFPYIDSPNFLNYLNRIIEEYQIDCIYPAHDSVSMFLSEFSEKILAQVIITEYEMTKICRSKLKTYEYLSDYNFIPKTYKCMNEVEQYPVF